MLVQWLAFWNLESGIRVSGSTRIIIAERVLVIVSFVSYNHAGFRLRPLSMASGFISAGTMYDTMPKRARGFCPLSAQLARLSSTQRQDVQIRDLISVFSS